MPILFLCMFAGDQTGLGPDATELATNFMLDIGATPDQVDLWAQDAVSYLLGANHNGKWASRHQKRSTIHAFKCQGCDRFVGLI